MFRASLPSLRGAVEGCAAKPRDAWWALDPRSAAAQLGCRPEGLGSPAAAARLQHFGPNVLGVAPGDSTLRRLLRQFESPLVLILVFAAIVAALVRDWADAAIVLIIVAGSGLFSFFHEHRASTALKKLRERVRIRTAVRRDGKEVVVPSEAIVPGDVVVLRAGVLIPADGLLLEARDLYVTQAALTGESMPVEKRPGIAASGASLAERTNCVFMGTSVRSGTGLALIVHTGKDTVYGGIADRLRLRPPETGFERGIRRYGHFLTQLMVFLVVLVIGANVLLERPPIDSLLFAIALAVGLSPELLPAIISVMLSTGAREMAARGVVVRRLNAIENFGSMDILCTDKTGTLTEGVMALERALDVHGADSRDLLACAALNAGFQGGLPNPLDEAIGARAAGDGVDLSVYVKVDEVPYDFLRRRLTIVVQRRDADERLLIAKGAFENVLDVCTDVYADAGCTPLDDAARAQLGSSFMRWSTEGYRVLGLATRVVPYKASYSRADESGLTFRGFLLFRDPPKAGIESALAALAESGIALKVITGDNRMITLHLAQAVGIRDPRVLSGAELDVLGEEALMRVAPEIDFFVEADPNQKERIILALKKAGHVVGFLGDGINDASALHAADVGISVDTAVDVAREAADLVLLEHDLGVLHRGVEQGRRTFANTLKYIAMTTSANLGNVISMAAASLFLPFLPLLAKQILLNNFLSDVPGAAIAGDRVDPEIVTRPHRWDIRWIRNFALVFGSISSAFDFLTFGVLLYAFKAGAELFRTGWFVESLMTELAIVLVVRTYRPFWRSRPGRVLLWSTLAMMVFTLTLPYLPLAGDLGFVPLTAAQLGVLLLITALYVIASEAAKRILYRGGPVSRARPFNATKNG